MRLPILLGAAALTIIGGVTGSCFNVDDFSGMDAQEFSILQRQYASYYRCRNPQKCSDNIVLKQDHFEAGDQCSSWLMFEHLDPKMMEKLMAYWGCEWGSACIGMEEALGIRCHCMHWSLPRGEPVEPDLHSMDTRCNPKNSTDIQRFNGKDWIHHFSCHPNQKCKDVNGIGSCQIAPGVYVTKGANESTVIDPIDLAPIRPEKKCNPKNNTETLAWNGTAWAFDGVCLSPYICHDFQSQAGFAFCSLPDIVNKEIWLPWPSLAPAAARADVPSEGYTRCASKMMMEQWNGLDWEPYRKCHQGWQCGISPDEPHNSGCFATSYAAVVPAKSRASPSVFRRQSSDSGLLNEGQGIIYQGEKLIKEGHHLVQDGREIVDHVYGNPDGFPGDETDETDDDESAA